MSTTYTPNAKLAMPAIGDTGWAVPINANCAALDMLAAVGNLAVTTIEVPSASLNVAISPGSYIKQDGSIGTFPGAAPQPVAASTTQVLYLDLPNAGALAITAAYPTTPHVRLATVIAGASSISSIVDNRQCFHVVGSWADGVNISLGSGIGTQIGTAPTQKLGFFGKLPTTQPSMGVATAGASYTNNEQAMLQAVYSAVRALGLGS